MGHVRIVLDRTDDLDARYESLALALSHVGYHDYIVGTLEDGTRRCQLPTGSYWCEDNKAASVMLDEVAAVLREMGELGWSILATTGETAWMGMEMGDTNGGDVLR